MCVSEDHDEQEDQPQPTKPRRERRQRLARIARRRGVINRKTEHRIKDKNLAPIRRSILVKPMEEEIFRFRYQEDIDDKDITEHHQRLDQMDTYWNCFNYI